MSDGALPVRDGQGEPADKQYRRLRVAATSAFGAAGTVVLIAPFVASMPPSGGKYGIWVLPFLAAFTVLAHLMKNGFWRDVH